MKNTRKIVVSLRFYAKLLRIVLTLIEKWEICFRQRQWSGLCSLKLHFRHGSLHAKISSIGDETTPLITWWGDHGCLRN